MSLPNEAHAATATPLTHPFPDDFVWGAATSSYQIEGAVEQDGRGPSIWDTLCQRAGAIADGSSGAVACDHYHRWQEDVALISELGLGAYRFSIAWPRVMPSGRGRVVQAGLDFYDRLVDGLLEAGIQPMPTLYHWDLPQPLEDEGGWSQRATAEAFVDYTRVVVQRLGDRIGRWVTHNEPWCAAVLGYQDGEHAPGIKDGARATAAAHHLLLSHGWATRVLREECPASQVGIVLNPAPIFPASSSLADREAFRRFDGAFNRWYLDPLYGRGYPADVIEDKRRDGHLPEGPLPFLKPGDLESIAAPTDFLGLNLYTRVIVRSSLVPEEGNAPRTLPEPPQERCTDMGWEVYPPGITQLLVRVNQCYAPQALYITECGAAYDDGPDSDGVVHDDRRIAFLDGYLRAAQEAIKLDVPLKGLLVWSLLDNFEWAHGYTKRFGLVHVDYDTLKRTPKNSAFWYRDVIARNGL